MRFNDQGRDMDEARGAVDKILSSVEEELWERRRILGSNWLKDDSAVMLAEVEHDVAVLTHIMNDPWYEDSKKDHGREQAMWRANRIAARAGVMAHKIAEEMEEESKEPSISAEDIKSEILRVMAMRTIACEEIVVILPDKKSSGEIFVRGDALIGGKWVPLKQTHGFTKGVLEDAAKGVDSLREFAEKIVENLGAWKDKMNVD